MDERQTGRYVRPDETAAEQFESWSLPDYSHEVLDESTLNALGYNRTIRWPDPEPEQEESVPALTAEELEQIHQAARDEGFAAGHAEGKQEGFTAGHAEGKSAGFAEGLAEGREQGIAEGQAEIAQHVQALTQALSQLHQPLRDIDTQLEQQLLHMVLTLTREVTQTEVSLNPAVLLETLRQAIAALPVAAEHPLICLHPQDLACVEQHYSPEQIREQGWRLRADPSMARGDVRVSEHVSQVRCDMAQRLAQVLEQFRHVNHRRLEALDEAVQAAHDRMPPAPTELAPDEPAPEPLTPEQANSLSDTNAEPQRSDAETAHVPA